ncbi:hypothetical protein CN878_20235 [Ochrobactrum sp. 695/2009]|nr:hypothetical protein CN881_12495 [Ochrobactrum sp. 721/2009]PJT16704.1 hypothetical protein CN880_10240 [Ochrobactrum sp. 720/2009]PJT26526.1 hypothetical protein CN879_06205 [Ochrobactrum sp. 715/2009]PJT26783.1 hypothetical protein CN878_20235 [Ochrobactrum sp. 695/2009]PJT36046.1 hypothetical protein CN877_08650 [Ochrobactrum sp. 689/2009]
MPSKEHEALVEKVAKAINGPFHPLPNGSPYTLDQLRDIHWQQINDVERKLCLSGAKAAISAIREAVQEPNEAMIDAAVSAWNRRMEARALGGTLLFGGNPQETMSANWCAMLAASALGEQSE